MFAGLVVVSIPISAFAMQSFRYVYNLVEIKIAEEKIRIAELEEEEFAIRKSYVSMPKEQPKSWKWW